MLGLNSRKSPEGRREICSGQIMKHRGLITEIRWDDSDIWYKISPDLPEKYKVSIFESCNISCHGGLFQENNPPFKRRGKQEPRSDIIYVMNRNGWEGGWRELVKLIYKCFETKWKAMLIKMKLRRPTSYS